MMDFGAGMVWLAQGASGSATRRRTPPPPVVETFDFGTPATPDATDSRVNLGFRFATLASGLWIGNQIWVPVSANAPVTAAYNADDTELLTTQDVEGSGLVSALFDEPQSIVPDVNYMASWNTDAYGFTADYDWPITTTRLYSDFINVSRYLYAETIQFPTELSNACYFIGPIVMF